MIEVRYRIMKDDSPAWETWQYRKGDTAASRILAGWRVSVDELFAGLV